MSCVRELKSHSEAPVLDAGCGYGRNAVALACRGISVVCVDQKKERLDALVLSAPKRHPLTSRHRTIRSNHFASLRSVMW
jgi:predicted RNA methylase